MGEKESTPKIDEELLKVEKPTPIYGEDTVRPFRSLKFIIPAAVALIILLGAIGFLFSANKFFDFTSSDNAPTAIEENTIPNITTARLGKKIYYIINEDYKEEFDYQTITVSDNGDTIGKVAQYNTTKVFNYEDYSAFCKTWNLTQKYTDESQNYAVIARAYQKTPVVKARLANAIAEKDTITLFIHEEKEGTSTESKGYFIAIPVSSSVTQDVAIKTYTRAQFESIRINSVEEEAN